MKRLALAIVMVPSLAAAQQLIAIDPGHGGSDPGGVGTGLQEKNINLDTSTRFRDLLAADTADTAGGGSWMVIMTRDDDTYVGLSARAAYANDRGADRFMSIHSNAFGDPSANGTETFAYAEGTNGAALRNLVQEEMIAAWGLRDRGNKTANFAVLRETTMPSELHELAFITNATDAMKLASPEERQKAAEAHLRAIQRHFGLTPYVPGNTTPPPDQTGSVAGTVVDEDGPVAGATVTLDGEGGVTTGEDGAFTFESVAVGAHTVEATAPDHLPGSTDVDVTAGQNAEIEVSVSIVQDQPPDEPDDPQVMNDGLENGCGCRVATRRVPPPALLLLVVTAAVLPIVRACRVRPGSARPRPDR